MKIIGPIAIDQSPSPTAGDALGEVVSQLWDILLVFTQGRQRFWQHVEAKIRIFAVKAQRNQLLEWAIIIADKAYSDLFSLNPTQALKGLYLQYPQELDLNR